MISCSFFSIILQLFNEPLLIRKGLIKFSLAGLVPKIFICNNVVISYVVKVFFYTFCFFVFYIVFRFL